MARPPLRNSHCIPKRAQRSARPFPHIRVWQRQPSPPHLRRTCLVLVVCSAGYPATPNPSAAHLFHTRRGIMDIYRHLSLVGLRTSCCRRDAPPLRGIHRLEQKAGLSTQGISGGDTKTHRHPRRVQLFDFRYVPPTTFPSTPPHGSINNGGWGNKTVDGVFAYSATIYYWR